MVVRGLHLEQQVEQWHGGGNEQKIALELRHRTRLPAEAAVGLRVGEADDILDMDEADGIVQRLAIDRQARMLHIAEQGPRKSAMTSLRPPPRCRRAGSSRR